MSKTIYTIDSRDNTMLEVMKQYFNISDLQMSKEINNMHDILVELLEKKGISYSVLKSVLIPQKKHHEIILVFDTLQIEDSEYGVACYNAVIKLLDKSESHSFLCGDYISKINTSWKNANELIYQSLSEQINLLFVSKYFVLYWSAFVPDIPLFKRLSGYPLSSARPKVLKASSTARGSAPTPA